MVFVVVVVVVVAIVVVVADGVAMVLAVVLPVIATAHKRSTIGGNTSNNGSTNCITCQPVVGPKKHNA